MRILLVACVLLILAVAVIFAVFGWTTTEADMSASGYMALALGVVLTLVVGCGLMALVFYSSRHGYDDRQR